MNARFVFVIALVVVFALPLTVTAQEKKDSGGVSITGCLNKGADADHFMIKDDKTGKETVVTGDAALLSKHANNHQVTITGTMGKEKDKDVMKATDLKMIAICK
jgi:uncharacterized protein YdeI (BOF family)